MSEADIEGKARLVPAFSGIALSDLSEPRRWSAASVSTQGKGEGNRTSEC